MEINYLAVILAALAAFFLGFFWYTIIFAKPWQKEIGMGDQGGDVQPPNLGKLLIGSLVLEIMMAFALATFIGKDADWVMGLTKGAIVGVAFVGFAFGVNYLFEGKSLRHWLINAGYNAVVFAAMGAIIGAM
jgi:hypothetical protein